MFATNPVTVLMVEGDNDAVAVRRLDSGTIVGFHNAFNFSTSHALEDPNLQQLLVDAVSYAASGGG